MHFVWVVLNFCKWLYTKLVYTANSGHIHQRFKLQKVLDWFFASKRSHQLTTYHIFWIICYQTLTSAICSRLQPGFKSISQRSRVGDVLPRGTTNCCNTQVPLFEHHPVLPLKGFEALQFWINILPDSIAKDSSHAWQPYLESGRLAYWQTWPNANSNCTVAGKMQTLDSTVHPIPSICNHLFQTVDKWPPTSFFSFFLFYFFAQIHEHAAAVTKATVCVRLLRNEP